MAACWRLDEQQCFLLSTVPIVGGWRWQQQQQQEEEGGGGETSVVTGDDATGNEGRRRRYCPLLALSLWVFMLLLEECLLL